MKCMVTGSSGFVGGHLKEHLVNQGHIVIDFDIKKGQDLLDYEGVRNYIDKMKPDKIFHLAGQAFVPESWNCPQRTVDVNIKGTVNLLEAVKNLGIATKIQIAGSSEEYGAVLPKECPISEKNELRGESPYGISKIAIDLLGRWYAKRYGMHIVITRAFNHTGPDSKYGPARGEMYVTSNFAKQVAMIEKSGGVLKSGDPEVIRDFTDVRDMSKAYSLAIDLTPGVYNIGTGTGTSLKELADLFKEISTVKFEVVVDETKLRKTDLPRLICDCSKFASLTGWKPKYTLKQSMTDLLNYWRKNIKVV
jgi:GDP-4-dehydro-6-deoxy-D-mannose reductase